MIGAMVLAGGCLVLCGILQGSLAVTIFTILVTGFYGCMPWTIPTMAMQLAATVSPLFALPAT